MPFILPLRFKAMGRAHSKRSAWFCAFLCTWSLSLYLCEQADGAELVPPGINGKTDAGAGQTSSRGPAAIFYNPANMIYTRRFEPYADISFLNLSYTYTHTREEFAPAKVAVNAPPVTLGGSVRLVPAFAFGVSFVPLGTGTATKIENVPIKLPLGSNPEYVALNVTRGTNMYKLGIGGAYRIGHPFTIGVGMIRTSEASTMQITDPRNEASPIVDAQFQAAVQQFVVGARSEIIDRKFVLGLSYRTAATLAYKGDIALNGGEFTEYLGAGYLPAIFGAGLETRFGNFGLFADYVREFWSAARTVVKMGVDGEPTENDYLDTNNIVAGARFWFGKSSVTGAFGYLTPNMGLGTQEATATELNAVDRNAKLQDGDSDTSGETAATIGGMQFGNMDGLVRMVFSGGYRYHLKSRGYIQGGLYYLTGNRTVPEGYSGEGFYSLSVILASLGCAYGF